MTSWLIRAKTVENAHFEFCGIFKRKHYTWGGLLIFTTTLASAMTAIKEQNVFNFVNDDTFLIVEITLALFVPICAAVLTFLKFDTRSNCHHGAAARFSSLKRRLSLLIARIDDGEDVHLNLEMEKISKEWDELTVNMPSIPRSSSRWQKEIEKVENSFNKQVS